MKIRELPEDIQKLAIANQIAQGNPENLEMDLNEMADEFNFDWDTTPEGYDFWEFSNKSQFDKARLLLNKSLKENSEKITYTEKEVKTLLRKMYNLPVIVDFSHGAFNLDLWFEENKKK